ARGEALAAKGDDAGLRAEADALVALLKAKPKLNDFELDQARIASQVLQGRVAMADGKPADAARLFRQAADHQDSSNWGTDPPPGWYPARRSLAAAQLKLGKPAEAAKEARASLKRWPQDG